MSATADKVRRIIIDKLNVETKKVTDNARFIDDLGADSLDTVELVMQFEEEFNVVISDDDQTKILTVGDAISFIEAHVDK
jgi:acyl carrier protein